MTRTAFQKRLLELCTSRQVATHVISELCGLGSGTLGKYIRGDREPTLKALVAIADYFGVSIDYLAGLSDEKCLSQMGQK